MPKRATLTTVYNPTRDRWKVDVPASLADSGKRMRLFFSTRQKARLYIENLVGDDPMAAIPPDLAAEAEKARKLLEPLGIDLLHAARLFAEAHHILSGTNGTLKEAATLYRDNWLENNASCLFGEAVAAYLDSRGDLRAQTLNSYRYSLERVFKSLHERILAEIKTSEIQDILVMKGATSARMHRRNLGAFWRWASKSPRSWARADVFEASELPRASSDSDISVLRPGEVGALMRAAELEGAAAAVSFAIAVFGGVRMAELERLTWSNVLADHIEIGKDAAKKHSRRLVPICPTLRAWLAVYRADAADSDSIVPADWPEVSKNVRRRAGWNVVARRLKNPPAATRGPWPTNACRHTCASVQVAIGTSLEDLTFKFGHSGGHDLLRAHYVARLTKKDALAILAVGPQATKIVLVEKMG